MDRSTTVILLSLALHLLLWWALGRLPSAPPAPPPAPTEVTYLDPKEASPKSKAKYVDAHPDQDQKSVVEEVHDTAALISNLNRRYKKQMIARQTGPERNSPQPKLQPSLLENKPVGQATNEERRERPRSRGEELMLPNSGAASHAPAIGGSSTSMQVPWVDFGDLSVLNSDRNVYYAFYSRMNEQVGNRWGMLVREMIARTPADRLREMAKQDRRTIVEIVLDPQGDFVRANFERGSGFEDLDWTGVEAFRMATPFINPPKGMVAPDGFIHVHVAFEVIMRPPMMGTGF